MWVNTHIESVLLQLLLVPRESSRGLARPCCGVYGSYAHRACGCNCRAVNNERFFSDTKKAGRSLLVGNALTFKQRVQLSLVHGLPDHGRGDHACHPCAVRQGLHGACLRGVLSAHQTLFAGWG